MATMKDIIQSPLLLALVIGGLLYISAFSLVYLKKAYDHCLELGITRKELSNVSKSSLIFSVVPSRSIVVGLFVLIAVLGSVWAWWRLSVIGSLSYETMISSSIAQVLGYASSAEMLESATGRQFGVVMILMSVGMLSGFLILLPLGKKLCKSVDRSAAENGGSTWKNVLSGVFMLVMFSVYIPILLFTDNVQAAVMITGLVIAIGVGVLAKRPGLAWLNNFVMAFLHAGRSDLVAGVGTDFRLRKETDMSKAKTETKMDSFQSWAHRWGRVGTLIALIYMVALPFVVLAAYDSIPSLGEVFNVNTFSILLIYIPVGFSEALSYTPILGCSAYLAFITGNIMNLKLPVAANAMNLTQKQPNTPEGEAIASVAVAVSSLMTIAILTLAAVCASFISPVFELPAVKTASGYLLPALFGSMALGLFASSSSGIKGVLPVLIIMTVVSLAARLAGYGSVLGGLVGIFIIVMLPIGILTSYVLWKKGKIQVVDKEQK